MLKDLIFNQRFVRLDRSRLLPASAPDASGIVRTPINITYSIFQIILSHIIRLNSSLLLGGREKAQKITNACNLAEYAIINKNFAIFAAQFREDILLTDSYHVTNPSDLILSLHLLVTTKESIQVQRGLTSRTTTWMYIFQYANQAFNESGKPNLGFLIDKYEAKTRESTIRVNPLLGDAEPALEIRSYTNFRDFVTNTRPQLDLRSIRYILVEKKATTSFNVVGCQGVNGLNLVTRGGVFNKQNVIANNMNKFGDFNILLGDNIYNVGAESVDDEQFNLNFHDLYRKLSFLTLGNHDYSIGNILGKSRVVDDPWRKAMYQVEHTHRWRSNWYMPSRYYVLESNSAIFYFIDSNTYIFDEPQQEWLSRVTSRLQSLYPDKWHIYCAHHPLETYGKRGWGKNIERRDSVLTTARERLDSTPALLYPRSSPLSSPSPYPEAEKGETSPHSASPHFVEEGGGAGAERTPSPADDESSEEGATNANEYAAAFNVHCGRCSKNMSMEIRELLNRQGIHFDVIFAAHDHHFAAGPLFDDPTTFQAIVGCGGKAIDPVLFPFSSSSEIGTNWRKHVGINDYGHLQVEIDENNMFLRGIAADSRVMYYTTINLKYLRENQVILGDKTRPLTERSCGGCGSSRLTRTTSAHQLSFSGPGPAGAIAPPPGGRISRSLSYGSFPTPARLTGRASFNERAIDYATPGGAFSRPYSPFSGGGGGGGGGGGWSGPDL